MSAETYGAFFVAAIIFMSIGFTFGFYLPHWQKETSLHKRGKNDA